MTKAARPALCMITATPLTVFFFLRRHIAGLAAHFNVTLACDFRNDAYLPALDIPARQQQILMRRKIAPFHDLLTLSELYRLFRRERYALVVTIVPKAGLLGMLAAWAARVPHRVHIFQGEVWAARRGFMRLLLQNMDRVTASFATDLLAVSAGERAFLEANKIAAKGRIGVLGEGSICGVDRTRFCATETARSHGRQARGIPPDAIVCLFIGRLCVDKGVLDLVAAFEHAARQNPHLWLVLAGPDEEGIGTRIREQLAEDLKPRVVIEGYTDRPGSVTALADFLCLPSYREAFGMVIIEAAAMGIPAIGSRIYGIEDAIKDEETGLLVPVRDIESWAAALTRLANDVALRQRLGEAARARVAASFDQEAVVARYVEYFRTLAGPTERA